jgi:hypothetical protein
MKNSALSFGFGFGMFPPRNGDVREKIVTLWFASTETVSPGAQAGTHIDAIAEPIAVLGGLPKAFLTHFATPLLVIESECVGCLALAFPGCRYSLR